MSARILQMKKKPPQSVESSAISDDEILTIEEAASFLKLSKRTLYYHVERGSIPFFKAGRLIRFSRQALLGWLSQTGHSNPNSVA